MIRQTHFKWFPSLFSNQMLKQLINSPTVSTFCYIAYYLQTELKGNPIANILAS